MKLKDILFTFKGKIGFIWAMLIVERALWVIEPTFFGKVLDASIGHGKRFGFDHHAVYFSPLLIWGAIFLSNTLIGFIRRILSQKFYLEILRRLLEHNLKQNIEDKKSVGQMASTANNTKEYIVFLKNKFPELLEHSVSIIGSILGLLAFDKRISLGCAVMAIPLYVLDRISSPKLLAAQKTYHDQNALFYDKIGTMDLTTIDEHFLKMEKPQIFTTMWSAFNFGVLRIMLFVVFIVVLYIAIDMDHF